MKINTIKRFCTSNGDGVRTAIFVSGCNNNCPGCFNKIAQDFNVGDELSEKMLNDIMTTMEPEYIDGLSILGGEPMDVLNQEGVAYIIKTFREKFGDKKDIWMWSGYYLDNIPETKDKAYILSEIDYLVDGPFNKDLYNKNLKYMGSSNQHFIKMK